MVDKYDQGDIHWNMNVAYLQRLDRRIDEADTAAINHDLRMWHSALYTIYANIHWKVKKLKKDSPNVKKMQQVKTDLDETNDSLKDLIKARDPAQKMLTPELRKTVSDKLRKIQIAIYDFIVDEKIVDIEPQFTDWKQKVKKEWDIDETD